MFDQTLDTAVSQALTGRPCSLILIDFDGFKSINEKYGHQVGDDVLREAASRIRRSARSFDLVARLGGDEFAILMFDQASSETAEEVIEKIDQAFSVPFLVEGTPAMLHASAGVSYSPIDAHERGALLRAAELKLYEAKRGRTARARASIGLSEMIERSQGRDLEEGLKAALLKHELEVHWQPYTDTVSGKVRGFEALARWKRKIGRDVPPSIFIPFAEACGMIGELDAHVLATACKAAAKWRLPLEISVNISAQWFTGPYLTDHIRKLLNETGLSPERLCLEVTERTVISTKEIAQQQIENLQSLGVSVALDDFGIGFSSFSYLSNLPFNKLKLDRSFVSGMEESDRSKHVARAIIQLGHRLGMEVCGEGVETLKQLRILQKYKCDLVQGFVIGKPSDTPQFVTPTSFTRRPSRLVSRAGRK